jgi:hypothetical protein
MATLHELDEYLGIEDVSDLIEVVNVDNYNEIMANKKEKT